MRSVSRLLTLAVSAAMVTTALVAVPAQAATAAPGAPGLMSHFDLARKDCLGTARNSTSKVWFTVANGVLSDVYYPTIDNTNNETLQFVVTDGSTFTDLQTRDMTYQVSALDDSGMACRVTSTAKSGLYTLTTDYFTDTQRNSVVMRTRLKASHGNRYQLYARFDGTINGNGGGGADNGGADDAVIDTSTGSPVPVSFDANTSTNAANRDYATPVYAALRADRPFLAASSGYAGTASDGLAQLDADHRLATTYDTAAHGNVVQTAQLNVDAGRSATLALGFGTTQAEAVTTAGATATADADKLLNRYQRRLEVLRQGAEAARDGGRVSRAASASNSERPTTCPRTCSRPARTRHSPAPSWLRSPARGARRFAPAIRQTPISARTARFSRVTCTRRSPA